MHMAFLGPALLFRSGGYWRDGAAWYRPSQTWDHAGGGYLRRPVTAARSVTVADMLGAGGDARHGAVLGIKDVEGRVPPGPGWLDDRALWATRTAGRRLDTPASVVYLAAPELGGGPARRDGRHGQVSRASRPPRGAPASPAAKAGVPQPQGAASAGPGRWLREWATNRQVSPASPEEAVAAGRDGSAPGIAELRDRLTRSFFAALWQDPAHQLRMGPAVGGARKQSRTPPPSWACASPPTSNEAR